MPIDTLCPACGARLRIPKKLVGSGRDKTCPKCGSLLPIVTGKPLTTPPTSPGKPPSTPPKKRLVRRPSSEFDVDLVPRKRREAADQPVPCPHCRQPIAADSALAGQVVTCPHCQGQLIMPGGAAETQTIACPYCEGHITMDPALAGQVVMCPHCRGQVQMPG
jgi:DNA-directed RNA polymerase subunit RPC12/RpoP